MSWMILELARNPAIQKKLQKEVDQAVKAAGGIENLTFKDFYQMNYVASCINETLRCFYITLWFFGDHPITSFPSSSFSPSSPLALLDYGRWLQMASSGRWSRTQQFSGT